MLKILINAYAISPHMGSEPGMAWNWCIHLAKHCELHIITEGEFRDKIELAIPDLPQGSNMHFYYNPVSDEIRTMCWNQGDWRFYYYYRKWQKEVLQIATEIIQNNEIDIVHQLNMIGFREPGYLWKITELPFIWGPTNAKEAFPTAYLSGASLKSKLFIYLKNTLTKFQLLTSNRVKIAVKCSKYVIAASTDSAITIAKYYKINPIILNESGCEISKNKLNIKQFTNNKLKLLWVGRFIFTKQLNFALKTLSFLDNDNFELHIVGGTNEEEVNYKQIASKLNISDKCIWYSKIPFQMVNDLMRQSDIFLFTSIAEGTPHVVLEAIGNNLPIVCFDTCGHGDSVNEKVGIKIPLSNPKQSIIDFAEKLNYLYNNRDVLKLMSSNCKERQIELSWDKKAEQMVRLYEESVSRNSK